jgi:hypothetical protein
LVKFINGQVYRVKLTPERKFEIHRYAGRGNIIDPKNTEREKSINWQLVERFGDGLEPGDVKIAAPGWIEKSAVPVEVHLVPNK